MNLPCNTYVIGIFNNNNKQREKKRENNNVNVLWTELFERDRMNFFEWITTLFSIRSGDSTGICEKLIQITVKCGRTQINTTKQMGENVVHPGIEPGSPEYRSDALTTRPLNQPHWSYPL